jgi:hypothetical protein
MEALKEHNSNIPDAVSSSTALTSKRHRSKRHISVLTPNHADSMEMSSKRDVLDEEEMVFLARRCPTNEPDSTKLPPVEYPNPKTSRNSYRELLSVSQDQVPTPRRLQVSRSEPIVTETSPVGNIRAPVVINAPQMVRQYRFQGNPGLFQANRLGAGLTLLKFTWIWMSCGALIMVDSAECSSDIITLVLKRLRQQMLTIGFRLKNAVNRTVELITDEN